MTPLHEKNATESVNLLLAAYFESLGRKRAGRLPKVFRHLKSYLYIHQLSVPDLSVKHLESFLRFLHTQGMSVEYASSSFSDIRAFLDYLVQRGIVEENNARNVLASPRRAPKQSYSDEDLLRVFKMHHPRS